MNKMTVLYICHDSGNGGSAMSLYNLVSSVRNDVCPIVLLSKRGPLISLLEKLGVKVLVFPFKVNYTKKSNLFRIVIYPIRRLRDSYVNAKCVNWVFKQFSSCCIDIVHTNSSVISFGEYLAKRLNAMHVWHLREYMDLDHKILPVVGFHSLQKKMLKADAIIAITQSVLIKWNMHLHHFSCVINDAVRSANDIVYDPEKGKYVLFCSAILSDKKGADIAAEIFCKSHIHDHGINLYYIGRYTEDYREKLERIAAKYKQEGSFIFLGYQYNIKKYMIKAAAFMMCSEFEGLGRVTIEAMFYGCPVLGRNSAGTKEIIEDGKNGLLYNTVEEATINLRRLIEDKPYSERMISVAAEDAREKYSEEVYGTKIVSLYHILMKQNLTNNYPQK